MLGPFSVIARGQAAGPWPRPSARRLCALVLVSPGRRVSRDLACEELFPALDPHAAARALSKALSMARAALAPLGEAGASLLHADLTHIWAAAEAEVDAEVQLIALREALRMSPGERRDDALVAALADEGELLADEPYADWAIRPREHLESLRQEARLALARDRTKGAGRSGPDAVAEAWLSAFEHDPACEEAAGALVRRYLEQGRRELAARTGAPPRTTPDPLLRDALDELQARDLVRQVAGPPDPGYRFRHALIQEATYGGLLRAQRRDLHARAAGAWEVRCAGREAETAAILGRHYAAAGETERALRYLELAGDHATAVFANDEAVSAYTEALGIADDRRDNDAGVRLRAKLANVLWRIARLAETRAAFEAALRLEDGNTLRRAHLLTRLGRLEMSDGRDDAAEQALDAAQALLGERPGDGDEEADQWLEMMIDGRAGLYVRRSEYDRALAVLEAARPVLAARGGPSRRYSFYQYLALQRVRRNRIRADERDVADFRRSLEAAEQSGDIKDVGYATEFLGWALLLRGDLAGARERLEGARSIAERVGESVLLASSLASLVIAAMASGDTETVRALAPRAIAAAEAVGGASVTAYAKAPLAWLAWQDGHPAEVVKVADELTALLATSHGGRYRWLYLFPLLAVWLADGDTGGAAEAARQMLAPSQQALPDELTAALGAACRLWDAGEADRAAEGLRAALQLAHELRYF
jgi:DNA-binding SARP family transcriptional activator